MTKKDLLIALFPIIVILAFIGVGVAITQWNISGSGSVVGSYDFEVYEINTENPCTNIDWGTLERGDMETHGITVANTGTEPLTLNMTYTISPTTVGVIAWNLEGTQLAVGNSVNGVLTLTTAIDAPIGQFTAEIYINRI